MIYFKKGLHKKAVLILGNLITIEIFDLFQTWQLSIRSWSILKLSLGFGLCKSKFTTIAATSVVIVLFTTPAYVSFQKVNNECYKKCRVLHVFCAVLQ